MDIISGTTVIRDLTLEIQMSPDVHLMVPTFICYDLQAAENGWQIASLRAYWELPVMITEFLRNGPKSLPVSLRLCAALLRNQGLSGSAGYLSALRRPSNRASSSSKRHCQRAGCGTGCETAGGAG